MLALDHRILRQFLAVAQMGTVRAAARALNMSQPPLTAAIRQLEERLGVALFERSVTGMTLTEAGRELAKEAPAIMGRLERTEARLCEIGGRARPMRIGFVSAALNGVLPALLRGLKAQGQPPPELKELSTPQQIEALTLGHLDVGLLHPPIARLPDFASRSLGRDPFYAALPDDHRLAQRTSLRFSEIANEPLVLFPEPQGPDLYNRIRSLVQEAGSNLKVAAEAKRLHSQLAIVAGGLGVGFVTGQAALNLTVHGVMAVPLTDTKDRLFVELMLVAANNRIEALLATLRQHS